MRDDLRRILGIDPSDTARRIPGTLDVAGREFRYVQDDGVDQFPELFRKLTARTDRPHPKSGGAISENCKLSAPDGSLFHALSYKGDVEGWRGDIEEAARVLGLQVGRIVADTLVLSDGRVIPLAECRVEFY